jgi:hypothetical protein
MRARDPHDDPPARRRNEPYRGPTTTLGDIREHGVRRLRVYCTTGLYCHHSAVIDADRWPDETVLLDLNRKLACTKCGIIGGQVRPKWDDRVLGESLTGAQWR